MEGFYGGEIVSCDLKQGRNFKHYFSSVYFIIFYQLSIPFHGMKASNAGRHKDWETDISVYPTIQQVG